MNAELKLAISFARLELLELDNGKRTLTQCPGVENVAAAIAKAKKARAELCPHGYAVTDLRSGATSCDAGCE